MGKLTLGLDYGTNSVRGLVVDTESGMELASAVAGYRSGNEGVVLAPGDPHLARQVPQDYLDGFVSVLGQLASDVDLSQIAGIGVDTTGSSPMPVDRHNRSLAEDPRFATEPAAMCWLWKDHTSHVEAADITRTALEMRLPYLARCGGTYSSEWFWSKILHCYRTRPEVWAAAASWVEICDWIPSVLCGVTDPKQIRRSRCAAGHKAMFEEAWGGLPSTDFLESFGAGFSETRARLYDCVYTSDKAAGHLSAEFASRSGLTPGIPVAVGAFDAHFGAVAAGAKPGALVKIMGTSTCDCMVHPVDAAVFDVPGMCGVVNGSIIPGMLGLEAGQSAVGDIFNWVARTTSLSHDELATDAAKLRPGQSGLVALDWWNGNRTILVDPLLSGMIVGLNLHTSPAEIYRAVIEATAFGALRIIERMEEYNVNVEQVIACGGIAEKSPLTMQIYADVFNRPVSIAKSDQTCALGSAIFAAVAAGMFSAVSDAQATMGGVKQVRFEPDSKRAAIYAQLYSLYRKLHDAFGMRQTGPELFSIMKELHAIKERSR